MFKNIVIELEGDFCTCDDNALSWNVVQDPQNRPELTLTCLTCNLRLVVPAKNFLALIKVKDSYKRQTKGEPKVAKLVN